MQALGRGLDWGADHIGDVLFAAIAFAMVVVVGIGLYVAFWQGHWLGLVVLVWPAVWLLIWLD